MRFLVATLSVMILAVSACELEELGGEGLACFDCEGACQCGYDKICKDEVCVPAGGSGQPCRWHEGCEEAISDVPFENDPACVYAQRYCDAGLACIQETCVPAGGNGQLCKWAADCDEAWWWGNPGHCLAESDRSHCDVGLACIQGVCVPDCGNRQCGDDGFGGSCGNCPGASCDGLKWTPASWCEAGRCLLEGEVRDCDDGNVCTTDSCDSVSGCGHQFNSLECASAKCEWGIYYKAVLCSQGSCLPQQMVDCDDDNDCTTDKCMPELGCQYEYNRNPCRWTNQCSWRPDPVNGGAWVYVGIAYCIDGGCGEEEEEVCENRYCYSTNCQDGKGCQSFLRNGYCDISGECYVEGAQKAYTPCVVCRTAIRNDGWSWALDGTVCAEGKTCQAHECR